MSPSLAKPPTALSSSHPINRGGPTLCPSYPKGGSAALGALPRGQTETGSAQRALPQGLSLADPLAQELPDSSHPRTAKQPPPRSQALTFGGSPHGGQREVAKDQQHHPEPRGTQSPRPHPREGPPGPRARPTSGSAAPCRVPLAVAGRYPGNAGIRGGPHGPCPDPAAPSLLFSAAAHKIFSLTTVRARARACLGNREGENRAAPPLRSGWEGSAASCLSFPSQSRRIRVSLAGGRQESSQEPMENPWSSTEGTT